MVMANNMSITMKRRKRRFSANSQMTRKILVQKIVVPYMY
jgi:ribosomal protein L28